LSGGVGILPGLAPYSPVVVIEQQLLSALRETPLETDCTVSVEVLKSLGHRTPDHQLVWLMTHRPATNGKRWHCTGGHWEYCEALPESQERLAPPFPARPAPTAIGLRAIVVKPLLPLKRTRA